MQEKTALYFDAGALEVWHCTSQPPAAQVFAPEAGWCFDVYNGRDRASGEKPGMTNDELLMTKE